MWPDVGGAPGVLVQLPDFPVCRNCDKFKGMTDFFLRLNWGPRAETIEDCTRKVVQTLELLASVDAGFDLWYLTTRPGKGKSVQPLVMDDKTIGWLLLRGQNVNDSGEIWPELGFSLYLKSSPDYSLSHILTIHCGSFSSLVKNSVVLSFSKDERHQHVTDYGMMLGIYSGLVTIWSPQEGMVVNREVEEPVLSEVYN